MPPTSNLKALGAPVPISVDFSPSVLEEAFPPVATKLSSEVFAQVKPSASCEAADMGKITKVRRRKAEKRVCIGRLTDGGSTEMTTDKIAYPLRMWRGAAAG